MRLVTRSDFDGLICAILLRKKGLIDSWEFVHPKDLQDGLFVPDSNDVLANVPYVPGCGMWFDHHMSEMERLTLPPDVPGETRPAPSAARIVYEYYGGEKSFPGIEEMMVSVDKVDSADLTVKDILEPEKWILLGFMSDPRTGLGRFKNFRISNYKLMEKIAFELGEQPIEKILSDEDVVERLEIYNSHKELFENMLKTHTVVKNNLIITDMRGEKNIWSGNRFTIYALYPDQNVSMWIVDGKNGQNVSIACGYSVVNRTATVNVGRIMLSLGGGGHKAVGTCQVSHEKADEYIKIISEKLIRDQ